jgi:hypothetical protein
VECAGGAAREPLRQRARSPKIERAAIERPYGSVLCDRKPSPVTDSSKP